MATIKFSTRIAHATDEEGSARYALQGTLVTPEGFAFATDSRFAACVKATVDGLGGPAMIPQELGPKSKADLKAEYHANGALKCEKHSVVKGQHRLEQADVRDGRFPQVGEILDGIDVQKTLVLAINASYLWRLAQAINVPDTPAADVVTLFIPKPDQDGVVTGVVGVLSNHDSLHGEDAGGFGMIMPCEADANKARVDFVELREAAKTSLDAAAQSWNDRCATPTSQEEDAASAKAKSTVEPEKPASPLEPPAQKKPRRKSRLKRSVA